jgi:hypothetical protein
MEITVENLSCSHCGELHFDIDKWALDPHLTHLCLHCGKLFKGSVRGVSHPTFTDMVKPDDVVYIQKNYRNIIDMPSSEFAQKILAFENKRKK